MDKIIKGSDKSMDKEFREFIVGKVLKVEQTKSIIAKANLVDGDIPYVTRTVSNNGYMRTCGNSDKLNKGNCITIGAETGMAFYQPADFVAGNKVYRLSVNGLNEKHYLYLAGTLNRLTQNYSYSNARIPEKIKKEVIILPIQTDENSNPIIDETHLYHDEGFVPDWKYMEKRVAELEELRVAELAAYLEGTGLSDYILTDEEEKILIAEPEMAEFSIGDLFKLTGVKQAKSQKLIPTTDDGIPYVVQSQINNMVSRRVDKQYLLDNDEPVCEGNVIVLGVTLPAVSYQPTEFGASQVITAYNKHLNEGVGLFLAVMLNQQMGRFSYTNKPGLSKYKELMLKLPIQPTLDPDKTYHPNGYIPDWDFMEKYIRAIEKIVIADVVKYKDEIIEKTKEVQLPPLK